MIQDIQEEGFVILHFQLMFYNSQNQQRASNYPYIFPTRIFTSLSSVRFLCG